MIEKKIHYIWFGGEKPLKIEKLIKSWSERLPDYEIIEWNEFNIDINKELEENKFFRECYNRKMWAFASDYIRVKIMYEFGGIYLDTDMEILKSLDTFLKDDFFIGKEDEKTISFGIVGAKKNHIFFKKMLQFYDDEIWKSKLYIVTSIASYIFKKYPKELENTKIYEADYFYPYSQDEELTEEHITENTYAIHHWGKSWKKNSNIYFLKYKHLKSPIRQIKILCKIIRNLVKGT
ncbi:MAG: glycosyltransferase family 32 protein [Cetobacterium sp.]